MELVNGETITDFQRTQIKEMITTAEAKLKVDYIAIDETAVCFLDKKKKEISEEMVKAILTTHPNSRPVVNYIVANKMLETDTMIDMLKRSEIDSEIFHNELCKIPDLTNEQATEILDLVGLYEIGQNIDKGDIPSQPILTSIARKTKAYIENPRSTPVDDRLYGANVFKYIKDQETIQDVVQHPKLHDFFKFLAEDCNVRDVDDFIKTATHTLHQNVINNREVDGNFIMKYFDEMDVFTMKDIKFNDGTCFQCGEIEVSSKKQLQKEILEELLNIYATIVYDNEMETIKVLNTSNRTKMSSAATEKYEAADKSRRTAIILLRKLIATQNVSAGTYKAIGLQAQSAIKNNDTVYKNCLNREVIETIHTIKDPNVLVAYNDMFPHNHFIIAQHENVPTELAFAEGERIFKEMTKGAFLPDAEQEIIVKGLEHKNYNQFHIKKIIHPDVITRTETLIRQMTCSPHIDDTTLQLFKSAPILQPGTQGLIDVKLKCKELGLPEEDTKIITDSLYEFMIRKDMLSRIAINENNKNDVAKEQSVKEVINALSSQKMSDGERVILDMFFKEFEKVQKIIKKNQSENIEDWSNDKLKLEKAKLINEWTGKDLQYAYLHFEETSKKVIAIAEEQERRAKSIYLTNEKIKFNVSEPAH